MKTYIKLIASVVLMSIITVACVKEDDTSTIQTTSTSSKHSGIYQQHNAPWVISMDWRFSFGTCATGPGVCFTDGDGDIVIGWGYVSPSGSGNGGYVDKLQDAFKVLMDGNNDPDDGAIAFRIEDDKLHMVFSRSLEESHFNIKEDVTLRSNVTRELGKQEIVIPAGRYEVDRSNFEHGEVRVPIRTKDIVLDYHEDYGNVSKKAYPVKREINLDSYLKDLNITRNDLKKYQIVEAEFTGIAYAEHLVDGKIIYVWHKYEKEPVSLFEGVLHDGTPVTSQRIFWCGNEFGGFSSFEFFWAFIDFGCWWC